MKRFNATLCAFKSVLLIVCLLPLMNSCIISQEANKDKKSQPEERRPKFPGGKKALFEFIEEETNYPASAKNKGIEGKVVVTFVIDVNGEVTDPKVVKSVSDVLDKEALRVVKSMPTWQPGIQKGKKVKARYKLPFNFSD